MIQLVFPEIEQDLSKRFSLGGQEKPRVAWCLISGDSDPHSWVPAHPGWVWLFYSHQAQQPDSLFASACCPASLFDFLGPCPCPSSYVIYTQFQFLFWSWLGLGQTLLLVCRTPSVHLCAIWERWWSIFISTRGRTFFGAVFKSGEYAELLPELVGEKCTKGAGSAKIASNMLHQKDSIPQTFHPVSNQPSFSLYVVNPDYEPDTVLGLQTRKKKKKTQSLMPRLCSKVESISQSYYQNTVGVIERGSTSKPTSLSPAWPTALLSSSPAFGFCDLHSVYAKLCAP